MATPHIRRGQQKLGQLVKQAEIEMAKTKRKYKKDSGRDVCLAFDGDHRRICAYTEIIQRTQ